MIHCIDQMSSVSKNITYSFEYLCHTRTHTQSTFKEEEKGYTQRFSEKDRRNKSLAKGEEDEEASTQYTTFA